MVFLALFRRICYEADRQKPAGDNVSQPSPQEREHLQESRATNEIHYTCASQEQDRIQKGSQEQSGSVQKGILHDYAQ